MPSLNKNILDKLRTTNKYSTFIETGTHTGDTIFTMEPYFKTLYTIEISQQYYNNTKERYNGDKINFILGDSSHIFSLLLPTINDDTIFFLDGHWSADNTGKGDKDCPLMEECELINSKFKGNAILIIDDFRLFGTGPNCGNEICNWEDISKDGIINILKDRITDIYHIESDLHKEDRLIIHIKNIV